MAKRYKATSTPASVERALGLLAAVVWCITQGWGWLRVLVATVGLALALLVVHTGLSPARGAASTWGSTSVTVVSPPWTVPAAPAVAHV